MNAPFLVNLCNCYKDISLWTNVTQQTNESTLLSLGPCCQCSGQDPMLYRKNLCFTDWVTPNPAMTFVTF